MPTLFVCQDVVQFAWYEEFDSWFAPKVLESLVGLGSIMSCSLVQACKIAFSINLLAFSSAVVPTLVILLLSLDTLSVKFHSFCAIMLNCLR